MLLKVLFIIQTLDLLSAVRHFGPCLYVTTDYPTPSDRLLHRDFHALMNNKKRNPSATHSTLHASVVRSKHGTVSGFCNLLFVIFGHFAVGSPTFSLAGLAGGGPDSIMASL